MSEMTYTDFIAEHDGRRANALDSARADHAQACEDAQAAAVRIRDLEARRNGLRTRKNALDFRREQSPWLLADIESMDGAIATAEAEALAANARVADLNNQIIALGNQAGARLGPSMVLEHLAAVTAAEAKVNRCREALAALDTRLAAAEAERQGRDRLTREAREDALAAALLGEAVADLPAPDESPDLEPDRATRAGLARRLDDALAELARVQALTTGLRDAVMEQELAAAGDIHARAAGKELAARTRFLALARLSGRPTRVPAHEPIRNPEGAMVGERERLATMWPGLFV